MCSGMGYKTESITGSMAAAKRANVVETFNIPESKTGKIIFLLPL
jgi:hypothetical protein